MEEFDKINSKKYGQKMVERMSQQQKRNSY